MRILNNTLVIEKWRIVKPKFQDSSIPLKELNLEDLIISYDLVSLLDMFIIVDSPEDEYLMMKSRSENQGKVFKDMSTMHTKIEFAK